MSAEGVHGGDVNGDSTRSGPCAGPLGESQSPAEQSRSCTVTVHLPRYPGSYLEAPELLLQSGDAPREQPPPAQQPSPGAQAAQPALGRLSSPSAFRKPNPSEPSDHTDPDMSVEQYLTRCAAAESDVLGIPEGLSALKIKQTPRKASAQASSSALLHGGSQAKGSHQLTSAASSVPIPAERSTASTARPPLAPTKAPLSRKSRGMHRPLEIAAECGTAGAASEPLGFACDRRVQQFNGVNNPVVSLFLTLLATIIILPIMLGLGFAYGTGWSSGCVVGAVIMGVCTASYCISPFVVGYQEVKKSILLIAIGCLAEGSFVLTVAWSATHRLPFDAVDQYLIIVGATSLLYCICRQMHHHAREQQDDFFKALYACLGALLWSEAAISLVCGVYLLDGWPGDYRSVYAVIRIILAAAYYVWAVREAREAYAWVLIAGLGFYAWLFYEAYRTFGTSTNAMFKLDAHATTKLQTAWMVVSIFMFGAMLVPLAGKLATLYDKYSARTQLQHTSFSVSPRKSSLPAGEAKKLAAREKAREDAHAAWLKKVDQGMSSSQRMS